MPVFSCELNIRQASHNDMDDIGMLHASALSRLHMYQTLFGNVDPDVARRWIWNETAAGGVDKGHDCVIVLERADVEEIIGVAWLTKFSHDNRPKLPEHLPDGFNQMEDLKINGPRSEWQKELLEEHGEYIWLTEFAIAPAYQSQGLGRVLLRHVITLVEKDRLSLALTAIADKVGFYSACGLESVGEPLMYGPNNSLTGVVKMRWQYSTSRF